MEEGVRDRLTGFSIGFAISRNPFSAQDRIFIEPRKIAAPLHAGLPRVLRLRLSIARREMFEAPASTRIPRRKVCA